MPISSGENTLEDISDLKERPILFGNYTDEGVKLEWNFSLSEERIRGFRIYRSLTACFKLLYHEVEGDSYEYLDEDVEKGRTYHYWITAMIQEEEESKFSEGLELWGEGQNVPLPPRNIEAFPGDEKVRLRGDKPLDCGVPQDDEMGHYILYREKEGTEISSVYPGNEAQSWLDEDLENGKEYTYRLKAQNIVGKSEPTEEVVFTPTADLPEPPRPENFRVFSGVNETELTWSAPNEDEDVVGYRIYKEGEPLKIVERDTTFYVDKDVNQGENYSFSIASMNVDGNESVTTRNVTVFVYPDAERPGSPSDLRAEGFDEKIKLTWDTPSDPKETVGFNIYRGEAEDDLKFLANVQDGYEFMDEDLENKRVYHYEVRAVDSNETLGQHSEMTHAVPLEEEKEEGISLWTVVGFVIIIAIAILSILTALKKREPKGPLDKIKKKK